MTAALFTLATFVSTLGGGLLALRFRDRFHYLLSFSAGVLLGVICFEVLPEIFELGTQGGQGSAAAMAAMVAGFLFFHGVEKFVLIHEAHEADYAAHRHPHVGTLSALALIVHSALDGVAIGLSFQVSQVLGIAVAMAVIAHDFCDGLNTVGVMLLHGNAPRRAMAMLVLDALAPVAGAASTLLVQVPPGAVQLYLGLFAGFLLYIGVSDILPEAHSRAPAGTGLRLIVLTGLGAMLMFAVASFAH